MVATPSWLELFNNNEDQLVTPRKPMPVVAPSNIGRPGVQNAGSLLTNFKNNALQGTIAARNQMGSTLPTRLSSTPNLSRTSAVPKPNLQRPQVGQEATGGLAGAPAQNDFVSNLNNVLSQIKQIRESGASGGGRGVGGEATSSLVGSPSNPTFQTTDFWKRIAPYVGTPEIAQKIQEEMAKKGTTPATPIPFGTSVTSPGYLPGTPTTPRSGGAGFQQGARTPEPLNENVSSFIDVMKNMFPGFGSAAPTGARMGQQPGLVNPNTVVTPPPGGEASGSAAGAPPAVTTPTQAYQPWNEYWQSVKGTMSASEAINKWVKEVMPLRNKPAEPPPGSPPPLTPVTPEQFGIYEQGFNSVLGSLIDPSVSVSDIYNGLMSGKVTGSYGTEAFYASLKDVLDQVATGKLTNPADISNAINNTFGGLWSSIAGSGTTVPKEYEQNYKDALQKASTEFTNKILWGNSKLSPYVAEKEEVKPAAYTPQEQMMGFYFGNIANAMIEDPVNVGNILDSMGPAYTGAWNNLIQGIRNNSIGVNDIYNQVSTLVTSIFDNLLPGRAATDPELQNTIAAIAGNLLTANLNPQQASAGSYDMMSNFAPAWSTPSYGESGNLVGAANSLLNQAQSGDVTNMGGMNQQQMSDFITYLVNNAMSGYQNQLSSLVNPQYMSTPTVQSGLQSWYDMLGNVT